MIAEASAYAPKRAPECTCGECGAAHSTSGWNDLPLVATLARDAVQRHLTVAVTWTIELRACVCGAILSRIVDR